MNDTKTPRTDAEATLSCDSGLRKAFVVHVEFARELEREIARLTAERDEARRMACKYEARYVEERDYPLDPPDEENIQRDTRRIAAERGWDCFKEDGK